MTDSAHFWRLVWTVLRRPHQRRELDVVSHEYTEGWRSYLKQVRSARSLEEWLRIPGVEDQPGCYNVDGKFAYCTFDSLSYYRKVLLDALRRHFPQAQSVTEYGAGIGRNLLYLKREMPTLEVSGYELCQPGVEIGQEAAAKFGIEATYARLDYLRDPPERYTLPRADVAFTMFSLEQIPRGADIALRNILSRAHLGSIHIEPVPENYPLSPRGLLGRIEHWKVDYLSGFDRAARSQQLGDVIVEHVPSSHNPLMFPSLYVLKKRLR